MRDFIKMIAVLFVACGLAAGSLGVVNHVTKEPIAGYEKKRIESGLREVSAGADEFKEVTAGQAWEAFRQGEKAGRVFRVVTQGYSGPIALMFGTGADRAVTGLQVLSHTETPGLGAKIVTAAFRDQFKGKKLENLTLKKDGSKGQIDAITAATISSRAVTKAVRATLDTSSREPEGGKP